MVLFFTPSNFVCIINKSTREEGKKYKYLEKSLQTAEESFDKH
jgi:hypothetical protein